MANGIFIQHYVRIRDVINEKKGKYGLGNSKYVVTYSIMPIYISHRVESDFVYFILDFI